MSDGEAFLARWSRRKRASAKQPRRTASPAGEGGVADQPPVPTAVLPELPSLDAIGPASDLAAFLAPGVPVELTNAALRRAWTADPAIRDFIGLSENAWDFTATDGVPGFGALDPDKVQKLLAELAEPPAPVAAPAAPEDRPHPASEPADSQSQASIAAPQQYLDQHQNSCQSRPRRRSGSALPQ